MFLNDIAHTLKWKTAKHIIDIFCLKHRRLKGILKWVAGFVPLEHFLWVIWKAKANFFLNYSCKMLGRKSDWTWNIWDGLLAVCWHEKVVWCDVIKEMKFRGSAACFMGIEFLGCIWRLLLSSLWPQLVSLWKRCSTENTVFQPVW